MTDKKWFVLIVCAGSGVVSISLLRDVFHLHRQRTVQHSEQKTRPVQTNKILDFFMEII